MRDTADPRSLADQLVRLAADEDTMAEAEALVCGLLAAGSLEPMRKVLDGRDDLPLLVRVLLADAATRTASCSPEEVHELFCEVNQRGRPEWRLWISAISADFSLWRGDLNGVAVAQAALIGAEEHDRGPLHAIARGRLRRLLGLATLLAGFGLRDAADDLVASAQADFEEAGCAEEQAITRGLFATVLILMEGDPGHDRIPLVRESVEELLAMGSDRVLLGWVALGWTSGVSFDFATVRDCLAELDAAPDGAVWPILRHFVSVLRAVLDLNANGPTPGVVATVLAEFRALNSSLVAGPTAAIYVAGVLLDAGAIDAAVEVMEIAGPPDPSISGVTGLYRREIDARIHLLQSPGPAAISTVEAVATEQKLHDARLAGEFLLRCSWDCIRAGLTDDGERLRARGETLLAPDGPPS
ncbi:MAG: hypothetical protein HYX32_01605 [Actinobacteria bacterium]|nr:hypothetical protein [Actinomycetota bacterium]